jgi:hypothetical protein
LKRELATRDEFEKKKERETDLLRQELDDLKNARAPAPVVVEKVVEKPVVSPELEERVRQKEAKLKRVSEERYCRSYGD